MKASFLHVSNLERPIHQEATVQNAAARGDVYAYPARLWKVLLWTSSLLSSISRTVVRVNMEVSIGKTPYNEKNTNSLEKPVAFLSDVM